MASAPLALEAVSQLVALSALAALVAAVALLALTANHAVRGDLDPEAAALHGYVGRLAHAQGLSHRLRVVHGERDGMGAVGELAVRLERPCVEQRLEGRVSSCRVWPRFFCILENTFASLVSAFVAAPCRNAVSW